MVGLLPLRTAVGDSVSKWVGHWLCENALPSILLLGDPKLLIATVAVRGEENPCTGHFRVVILCTQENLVKAIAHALPRTNRSTLYTCERPTKRIGAVICQNGQFSESEHSALQNECDPAHQDRGLRYVL